MLKVDYLSNVLNHFESSGMWFFMKLSGDLNCKIVPKDLLDLPSNYIRQMRDFVSRYTIEELEGMNAVEFIQESTGENIDKILKLIKIAKKKQSLEQDFV